MSCRVREHQDHTKQSVFHHGLIKLIISIVLQKREKTWEHFIFWSSFKIDKEEQSQRRQVDKGQNLIKKLRKKVTIKDEENDKPGEASNQENKKFEFGQRVNDKESKVLQSEMKEVEPVIEVLLAESIQDVKEDTEEQKKIPITVLSEEDEKYLFDEARIPITNESRVCAKQEIHTHCDEETMSRRKKMKVVEFASITHQGKALKMLGEVAIVWRPKTRPKNKLRLSMKSY